MVDDYGHTAWMGALNRAIDDEAFAWAPISRPCSSAWDRRRSTSTRTGGSFASSGAQGEFWPLGLMLAGLKTHCGGLDRSSPRALPIYARLFCRWSHADARHACRNISGRMHAAGRSI